MKNTSRTAKFLQTIFFTIRFYFLNNLDASASACTFNFIFSFIPILVMILFFFIKALPDFTGFIETIDSLIRQYTDLIDVKSYVTNLKAGNTFSFVNILLIVFIIMMARKLFISIMQGMKRIFNTKTQGKAYLSQVFTFLGEIIVVIICALAFFAAFITRQIFSLKIFKDFSKLIQLPAVFGSLSTLITNLTLYAILLVLTFLCYKFTTRTKPPLFLSLASSFLCTACFYIVNTGISTFINRANYSALYGVLSSLIILLFEIYVFFILFFFFAQMIFSFQFYDSLLLAELYLLPQRDDTSLKSSISRFFFARAQLLIKNENATTVINGQYIYNIDDKVTGVYFIAKGSVQEFRQNKIIDFESGSFFGEREYMLGTNRTGYTRATSDSIIVFISRERFDEILQMNQRISSKALSKLSRYGEVDY